ncbi:SCP2 sterol-binding domain-containing protein [Sessilibacter sp. MAH1]
MFGPTVTTTALASVQLMINQALKFDPVSKLRLQSLEGRLVRLTINNPAFVCFITAIDGELRLQSHGEQPEAEIRGSLSDLIKVFIEGKTNLADSQVEIIGSAGLVQQWQEFSKDIEIDWEEIISQYAGDTIGHQVAEVIRSSHAWGKTRRENIRNQLLEYAIEEKQLLPNQALFKDFCERNQQLRLDIDRLEARIERLTQLLIDDESTSKD